MASRYRDLREFIAGLEERGELRRIRAEVDPYLEITEIADRTLRAGGPALLFENPRGHDIPLLANLFGTEQRVALGMGAENVERPARDRRTARLPAPAGSAEGPARCLGQGTAAEEGAGHGPEAGTQSARPHQRVYQGDDVDLRALPIQTCWPGDAGAAGHLAPGHHARAQQGATEPRHLPHAVARSQQADHALALAPRRRPRLPGLAAEQNPGERYPVAIALGADPATTLGAVTPVPDALSEYAFAGLLRGAKTELYGVHHSPVPRNNLQVPATAEIILEGYLQPGEEADEGPFGDHTGYYNEVERFPVFTVETMATREAPIYHSTYTGRPPDEPAILGVALNEVFVPLLKKQFPEIVDFYLPPEGCSYRMAVVSMRKEYPGHAKRVMLGIWSFLRQFMYTKFIVVTDDDVNARDWRT
jgi:4-hydroxy-3-polyprenylbenzoate decarboxylase